MSKAKAIFFFFFLQTGLLFSQSNFVQVDSFEVFRSYGNCVVQYDEDLYIGVGRFFKLGWEDFNIFFAQYNAEGNLIHVDTFKEVGFLHNDLHSDLFVVNQKVYALPRGDELDYLLEYDPLTRDISILHNFDETSSFSSGFEVISPNEFVFLFLGGSPQTSRIVHFNDGVVVNEFIQEYPSDAMNLNLRTIELTSSQSIMITGHISTDEVFYVPIMYEYNLEGELLWQYRFPETYDRFFIQDFVIDQNDDLVLSYVYEKNQFDGSEPRIVKVDREDGIVWDVPFGQRSGNYFGNEFSRILLSQDNDGYILGGSITKDGDNFKSMAVGKISTDGDSLWMQTYAYTTGPGDNNFLHDLEHTSDNGYIGIGGHVYGSLDSLPPDGTFRKTLLLKTNEDGLLSVYDNNHTTDKSNIELTIQPNPVNTSLNIIQKENDLLLYEIYTLQGKLITTFNNIDTRM